MFYDGKGIKIAISFAPLLPPQKQGEKCCRNAKAATENCNMWLHEGSTLAYFVETLLDKINCSKSFLYAIANRSKLISSDCFTLHYTIPQLESKDVLLNYELCFKDMIDDINQKNNPNSSVKLFITEAKVPPETY